MNVRSIKPKTPPFSEYVTSKNLDIVVVTETWLKHDETQSTVQVLYSTPDQSKSGSACHMTRSANRLRHSVII